MSTFTWHEDEDFDTQPGYETDLLTDPAYLQFAAECDAQRDFDHEIPMHEGIASLVVAQLHAGVVVTKAEVHAYRDEFQRLALRRLSKDTLFCSDCLSGGF